MAWKRQAAVSREKAVKVEFSPKKSPTGDAAEGPVKD
jgi:hypothetical protein